LLRLHDVILNEILQEILPPRALRANPRVVKRKMSKFHVKGPQHHNWPQPLCTPEQAVQIA